MTYDEMRIRQAWPYEVKVKHAEKVAREFIEKVSAGIEYGGEHGNKYRAHNVHISVGGKWRGHCFDCGKTGEGSKVQLEAQGLWNGVGK